MKEDIKLIMYDIEQVESTSNYTIPYGVKMINAPFMWKNNYTGKGVVVAVIDTGCNTKHEALENQIIGGYNFSTDDNSNPKIYEDYQGHGTHVCGTIAANSNKVGITGVAPDAKLLVHKALDKNGTGSIEGLIKAINYAIAKKVDIISMSLGGTQNDNKLHKAILNAVNNDILVVCAAGNSGDNSISTNENNYPGSYKEVIQVGAIDKNKKTADFTNSNDTIDLVAPGVKIKSTYLNQGYATLNGTSMATPHVSGALALLIEWSKTEFGRKLTEAEYYAQLIKCTTNINTSRKLQGSGALYLDISK